MKHPVKTLSALALIGAIAPNLHAAVAIKDDDLSVSFKLNIQDRVSLLNDATDAADQSYDPMRGQTGKAEDARFDVRRARFGAGLKYGDHWAGALILRADREDQNITTANTGTAAANVGRPVQLYYAYLQRIDKCDNFTSQLSFGLQKSFNDEAETSSATFLFPTDSIVKQIDEERGVGIGYRLTGKCWAIGGDIQNNSTNVKDAQAGGGAAGDASVKNGLFYSGRIELSPGSDFWIAKNQESFTGKEGTGLVFGFDYQLDQANLDDNGAAGTFAKRDRRTYGPDVLFHWNSLTVLAEARWRNQGTYTVTDATNTATLARVHSRWYDAQIAYAFAIDDGVMMEPAFRYSRINNDVTQNNENGTVYGAGTDNGNSGRQFDIGVNFYFHGHDNKLQIAYQRWVAESGPAVANIVRVQHQINF